MANWHEILNEIDRDGSTYDIVRKKYLQELQNLTKRNVIAYYSGWLQKQNVPSLEINDNDKNGFMNAIHKLDKAKGLDLILHTPGGDTAATESIIYYLKTIFSDIRVIVPQLAMSGGTMIACAAQKILMGKHSSLGPIDPQFGGIPAHAIIEEFKIAHDEIKDDQTKAFVWQPILSKYNPTLIGECNKAITWSEQIAKDCLKDRMFSGDPEADNKIEIIIQELGNHSISLSHARHLSLEKCKSIGLKVEALEDNQKLQDAVLSVHHSFIHTLTATPACKIIENHNGIAFIQATQTVLIQR
ncbi:MAG: ATP-dependent Clp protease proteolytic subunit [Candidatus Pacebacteria bacterium]|nr:ATP-dependent Clp protease proteolytic subunit [Candidatus Paceibacterota bacterium]